MIADNKSLGFGFSATEFLLPVRKLFGEPRTWRFKPQSAPDPPQQVAHHEDHLERHPTCSDIAGVPRHSFEQNPAKITYPNSLWFPD